MASSEIGFQSTFVYGTAWKKERTTEIVKTAISSGFRVLDTAAQPKHYREDLVGKAVRECTQDGFVQRSDIFVQTKFTAPQGQDPDNMPYNPENDLETQIRTSVLQSLRHFQSSELSDSIGDSYLDCLLLHSPLPTLEETLEAWTILQSYVPDRIRYLGISNVPLSVLKIIYRYATVKPAIVQKRFCLDNHYDSDLRQFCKQKGIVFQSFWTLTANPGLLEGEATGRLSNACCVSREVALYALISNLGIMVLNGTSSKERMVEDIEGIAKIVDWSRKETVIWADICRDFQSLLSSHI
ncbi:aldo-keto reductase-like protein [Ampelomyces quisqualis]|uniref:Aldo-keto reductase-like protein n=1 Tax=Ampelomyces quisqualis TaxID=50730 RepID=A0A6A5QC34_AMPQU|nr:aldo-keto reductase-like protein [Ampelomyces quisqualis]